MNNQIKVFSLNILIKIDKKGGRTCDYDDKKQNDKVLYTVNPGLEHFSTATRQTKSDIKNKIANNI